MQTDEVDTHEPPAPPPLALLHRWFIQYNPLYLVSAAVVLWGMIELQRAGLSQQGNVGQLAITAIAEAYAWALVGGAALLVRLRLRRPALMLALLTAAFQADLTLHTETAPHLGLAGALASALWVASAGAKMMALGRALRLRLSHSAVVVAVLGAAVLAAVPWCLRLGGGAAATATIGVAIFVAFAAALWTRRAIVSQVALDPWAQHVAVLAQRGVWIGWGVMLLAHASFWVGHVPGLVDTPLAWPLAALLSTRMLRREASVWVLTAATLVMTGIVLPHWLSLVAALAAVTLALHALRQPTLLDPEAPLDAAADPYRSLAAVWPPSAEPRWDFFRASRGACVRLGTGVIACAYLACWSVDHLAPWWQHHIVALDLALVVVVAAVAHRVRTRLPWLVPALSGAQLASVHAHRVMPQSHHGQALALVVVGFALLCIALVASIRWRRGDPGG